MTLCPQKQSLINLQMCLSYDGSAFFGWQSTSTGPSIEETLKKALEEILQEPISLQAASRTDAGVHALGQIVNFFSKKETIDLEKLKRGVNALLPKSIRVHSFEQMPSHFHPTLDAMAKEYHYEISVGPVQIPQRRFYAWHVYDYLNVEEMQKACPYFLGTHDFSAFCNARKDIEKADKTCFISKLSVIASCENEIKIVIVGKKFLYKMVRNIVGTLVDVGKGKIKVSSIPYLLEKKQRSLSGMTAPAHGLTLIKVFYDWKK